MVIATPRILDLLWIAINFYYPLIIVPLAAGFLYFRTNSVSFLFSVSFAIIGVFIGAKLQGKLDVLSTVFGITGSAIGLFGAHRLQQIFGVLNNVARQEKIDLAQWYKEQAVTLKVSTEQVPTELRRLAREKQKSLNPRGLTKKVATCRYISTSF